MARFFVAKTMKSFAAAFYKSTKWEQCRLAYIASRIATDGGLCERCHRLPGYIVHHKVYLTENNISDPLVSLNPDNLEYVCKPCHDDEHLDSHQEPGLLCSFDEEGRPCRCRDR